MPIELATLRTRRGEQGAASAEVVRYGGARRYGAAAASVVFGFTLGIMVVPFPVIHVVLTWLLPLLGILGAVLMLRVRARVAAVSGACPACRAAVEAGDVGAVDGEPIWLKCPGCGQPLEVLL